MKKYKNGEGLSILSIVLLLLIIMLLSLLFIYMKEMLYSGESTAVPESGENAQIEAVQKQEAGKAGENLLSEDHSAELVSTYVFVGDSRYVGMSEFSEDSDIFICENNVGHKFLLKNMEYIQGLSDGDTAVIVGLGVNDVNYNSAKYIDTLNQMAETMDAHIFYMLVNPVDEEKEKVFGYGILNEKIDKFNKEMIEGLNESIRIIDTSSYLKMQGYVTVDGLHYTEETYGAIYDYIKQAVAEALY